MFMRKHSAVDGTKKRNLSLGAFIRWIMDTGSAWCLIWLFKHFGLDAWINVSFIKRHVFYCFPSVLSSPVDSDPLKQLPLLSRLRRCISVQNVWGEFCAVSLWMSKCVWSSFGSRLPSASMPPSWCLSCPVLASFVPLLSPHQATLVLFTPHISALAAFTVLV